MTVQRGSLMMSQWKRDIIANNLYGVDIKPEAIEIAKLRMWLSLVVDVPNIEDLEPLPNLDYKLMCGNSLISTINGEQLIPDPTKDQQLALNITPVQAAIQPLLKLQQQYYSAQYEERKILRQQIIEAEKNVFRVATADRYQFWNIRRRKLEQDIRYMSGANRTQVKEQQIIAKKLAELEKFTAEVERGERSLNFFQFHLHFNDVFQEKGGFDIVIGNPPYISHDKISVKDDIKSNYQAYEPFADIYCYFIERAIKLQNSKGLLSLITSNSYLKAEYGAPIRKLIKDENFILKLINLEDSQIFSDAIVNVAILLSSKLLSSVGYDCRIVNSPFSNNSQFSDFIKNNENIYNSFPLDSGVWSLVDPKFINLKNKIDKSGKTLEQLGARIKLGLATGSNEAFIITESMKKDLCEKSEVNSSIIKPILRGRDIARYSYSLPNLYILLTKNGIDVRKDYPDIYQHLDSFGEKFKTRGAKGQHWTNLRACSFFDDFAQEKIVWMELTDSAKFTLCTEEIYLLNSAYFLTTPTSLPIKYLLGILNSNVIQFYLSLISETSGVGTNRWINNHVKNFPIPRNNNLIEKQIILIVEKLLAIKNNDPESNIDELENKLNHLVYELYGLNTEEVSMIEKSI